MAHPGNAAAPGTTTSAIEVAPPGASTETKPAAAPTTPAGLQPKTPSRPHRLWPFIMLLAIAIGVGGFFARQKFGHGGSGGAISGPPLATQKVKDLTINFIHPKGRLQKAMNEIVIEFRDTASGELVDVGTVKFDLDMNMPGMTMHNGATIEPTGTPGQYRAQIKADMAGDWMATVHYAGPHGNGSANFSINVKQ